MILKNKRRLKKGFIYRIIFIIALGVFVFSAYQLFTIYKANYDEKNEKDRISDLANIPKDIEKDTTFDINFEELKKINPDLKAWVIIPGTNISYPIVQGKDNAYYLTHTFEKNENYAGAIFLDAGASPDFQDLNTIIYGHNVKHGTMFAEIEKFKSKEFYEQHRYVYILSEGKNYRAEIMSMYSTDTNSDSYMLGYTSWETFSAYVDLIKDRAEVSIPVEFKEGDRMITLSTCSYERGGVPSDARYLLHAKLVEWDKE